MKKSLIAMALLFGSSTAFADCPLEYDVEKIVAAIMKTQSCAQAVKLADECAFGSSADLAIAGTAKKMCESRFIQKLTPVETDGYNSFVDRCQLKFPDETGTLGMSLRAFCALDVAQRHAELVFQLSKNTQ